MEQREDCKPGPGDCPNCGRPLGEMWMEFILRITTASGDHLLVDWIRCVHEECGGTFYFDVNTRKLQALVEHVMRHT